MVTPTATAAEVTTYGSNVFRACFLDPYQGEILASYANEKLSAKTAAVLYDSSDDYSIGIAESFKEHAEAYGIQVVAYEAFGEGDVYKRQLLEQEKDFIGPASLSENSFESHGTLDIDPIRNRLYRTCEAKGIGITVMKSLAAGVLLDEKRSPFGMALSVPQCLHYALTRPAVASVVLGMQTPDEVEEALRYEIMEDSQRDYTAVFSAKPQFNLKGHCMYCNHCLPCVSHINIAAVNKYLDLAQAEPSVPPTVRAHYDSLEHTAADCIACGACEKRCPFEVPVIERMQRAQQLFGK